MTDPATLISAAITSVFGGDTPKLRTSYDRWTHDGEVQGGVDHQSLPTVLLRTDSSDLMGLNAAAKHVSIVESPVLYVGIGGEFDPHAFAKEEFIPLNTDVLWEFRYSVDRNMEFSTPFYQSSLVDSDHKNLYTIDSFRTADILKNWQSTDPNSILLSTSEEDKLRARRLHASLNTDRIYEQQELMSVIGSYDSHPQESKLRDIRYITIDVASNLIYGTGTTTEQRRRLTKTEYQGSNPATETTEDAQLFTINTSTGVSTVVAAYNGTFWDSALVQQIHLLAYDEANMILYGIMPPGSHQSFLDTSESSGDAHIGTLVTINVSTAAITEVGGLFWTPGTDGFDTVEILNFSFDDVDNRVVVLVRTNDGAATPTVSHSLYEVDVASPASWRWTDG